MTVNSGTGCLGSYCVIGKFGKSEWFKLFARSGYLGLLVLNWDWCSGGWNWRCVRLLNCQKVMTGRLLVDSLLLALAKDSRAYSRAE